MHYPFGALSSVVLGRKQVAAEEQRSWDMLSEKSKKGAKVCVAALSSLRTIVASRGGQRVRS